MYYAAVTPGAEITEEQIRRFGALLEHRIRPFTRQMFQELEPYLPSEFRNLSFLTPEEALQSLERVATRPGATEEIRSFYEVVIDNVSQFFRRRRVEERRFPLFGYISFEYPEEQIQKMITLEAVRTLGIQRVDEILGQAIEARRISRTVRPTLEEIYSAARWQASVGYTGYRQVKIAPEQFAAARDLLQGDHEEAKQFRRGLRRLVHKDAPVYSIGPLDEWGKDPDVFPIQSEFTVVSRSRVLEEFAGIKNINDFLSALGRLKDELLAGRHDMDNVTRLTMVPYYAVLRLSNILESIGLGLSWRSGGSTWELMKGIFLKRALLFYGLWEGFHYADFVVGEVTGRGLRQRYWDMIASARLEIAEWQDETGITEERKRRREISGVLLDPLSELPFIGWIFDEPMSKDELIEYYKWGRQPIRRNRYWFLSNSPFIGEGVAYYLPNEYIMGTTDWRMTDTLYGSAHEYWSRRWFPTPSYPLAPIKFLLDPYWLEKRTYEDRPYPYTGYLASPELPFAPLINATIGQLIKPVKPMHEEELKRINEEIRQAAVSKELRMAVGIERRGRIIPVQSIPVPGAPDVVFLDEDGEYTEDVGWAVPGGIAVFSGGAGEAPLPLSPSVLTGGSRITAEHLTRINRRLSLAGQLAVRREVYQDIVQPIPGAGPELILPDDPSIQLAHLEYSLRELAGIYGWLAEVVKGGEPLGGRWIRSEDEIPKVYAATADRMAGIQRFYWWSELGGLGGEFAEFWRRMVPHPQRVELWNPIPNTMPEWLPEEFRRGDPYSVGWPSAFMRNLEVRLPGGAYEATHTLFSDPYFGRYGALTRYMILRDVAPYSEETKQYEQIVRYMFREGLLPEEWKPIFRRYQEEAREQGKRYTLTPYKFTDVFAATTRQKVTVTRIIDSSTFLTAEFPENPIRLAGVRLNQQMPISMFLQPGMQVEIVYNSHEGAMVSDDLLRTIRAVVYINGQNLNYELLRAGIGRETSEEHPAAIIAKYTPEEIAAGQFYEFLAHLNIPILHRKFMPVDSPLEYYERRRVYGKEFQSWDRPWEDIIKPTYRSYAARDPLTATALGAFTGAFIGQVAFGGGTRAIGGAIIGGTGAMLLSILRMAIELITGRTYIPPERQRERELNEYFDVLEYIKYRALYERAVEMARRHEFRNIDRLIEQVEERYKERRKRIRELEEEKRRLILRGESRRSERIQQINEEIRRIQSGFRIDGIKLGPWSQAAIYYRMRYESTLYGLDLDLLDYTAIYRALPSKDREFFEHFAKETDPKKRERILELVPENQKRIYRRIWYGEKAEPPPLEDFFKKYPLPTPDWIGWRPDVELDWVKARIAVEEGIDPSEVDVWWSDFQEAVLRGIEPFDMSPEGMLGFQIKARLESILKGRGLTDIEMLISPSSQPGIRVDLDIVEDPRERIAEAIREGRWI